MSSELLARVKHGKIAALWGKEGRLPTSYAATLGLMPPARARGCARKDYRLLGPKAEHIGS
eukprot:COSAG05_NODE_8745_length_675_cov_2.116319_2_plen_60_part_01